MNYPVIIAEHLYPKRDWVQFFKGFQVSRASKEVFRSNGQCCIYVSDDLFINYRWERLLESLPAQESHLLIYGDGKGPLSIGESGDFLIRKISPSTHVDGMTFAGISLLAGHPSIEKQEEGGLELSGKKAVLAERRWPSPQGAIFLDRDGVLIEDRNYVADYRQVTLKRDLILALSKIITDKTLLFVVSNQSGVGRGYFSLQQVQALHQRLDRDLKNLGLPIVEWVFCPYHKTHGKGEFLKDSFSRKPYPGMVLGLCERHFVNLEQSWMIGDQVTDHLQLSQLKTLHIKGSKDLSQATAPVFSCPKELVQYMHMKRPLR